MASGKWLFWIGIRTSLFLNWSTCGEEGVDVIGRDKVTVTALSFSYRFVSISPKPPSQWQAREKVREPSMESPLRVEAEWRPIAETWNDRP